jgi:hypothetical protein
MKLMEWFYCKPHACILTAYREGSLTKYSPSAAMHLAQRCCHCWKHFWNFCCGIALSGGLTFFNFFCMSLISWVFATYRADSIFEQRKKIFGAKSGEQGGCSISVTEFLDRKPLDSVFWCELEHCHGGESNRWAKVQAFFYTQLHITPSVFPHNKLGWLLDLETFMPVP